MHCGKSFNSSNKASKGGSPFGWCKQDWYRSPCLGSGLTLFLFCSFNFQVTIIGNLTYCDCRLHIFLHHLTMTTWKKFMQLWMVFFLLISGLERSARHQLNSMLGFLPKVRFTITRYTMIPSWTHSCGILLTTMCINSIALLWEKLQNILLGSMISLLLRMHLTMTGYQIQWNIFSDLMWKKWYLTSSKSRFLPLLSSFSVFFTLFTLIVSS